MAGTLTSGTVVTTTLSDGTNSTSSTNPILGSAKAWVNFNGTGTVAIRSSYNVSSITDNGTGDYTINFINAMPNANYSASMAGKRTASDDGWFRTEVFNTTSLQVVTNGTTSNSRVDWEVVSVSIFSS